MTDTWAQVMGAGRGVTSRDAAGPLHNPARMRELEDALTQLPHHYPAMALLADHDPNLELTPTAHELVRGLAAALLDEVAEAFRFHNAGAIAVALTGQPLDREYEDVVAAAVPALADDLLASGERPNDTWGGKLAYAAWRRQLNTELAEVLHRSATTPGTDLAKLHDGWRAVHPQRARLITPEVAGRLNGLVVTLADRDLARAGKLTRRLVAGLSEAVAVEAQSG